MKKKHIIRFVLCPSFAFLVFVLFLIPSFKVAAATNNPGKLPYNISTFYGYGNYDDINSFFHDHIVKSDLISAINTHYNFDSNVYYIGQIQDVIDRDNFVGVTGYIYINPIIDTSYSSNFDFTQNNISIKSSYVSYYRRYNN